MAKKEKTKHEVDSELVRIYSKREGPIHTKSGIVEYEKFSTVSKQDAEWLLKTYPNLIKKVD